MPQFRDSQVDALNALLRGTANVHRILTSAAVSESMPLIEVLRLECVNEGYARVDVKPSADATYDVPQTRAEVNWQSASYNATNASYTATHTAIIRGAKSLHRLVTNIDATGNKLNFLNTFNHGLVADDPVVVLPGPSGVVPAALLSGGLPTILYVRNPVFNSGVESSIQLALTAGGAVIDFAAGTSPIYVVSAGTTSGLARLYSFNALSSTATISPGGAPLTITGGSAVGDNGAIVNTP